ncbi:hypothetical protein Tco_0243893, partial [Tanacetum coccineum]
MKRAGKDFSGRITPLFDTMMVKPVEEMGEDSDNPTNSTPIPIINQPSSSSQPKLQEVPQDEVEHEESAPIGDCYFEKEDLEVGKEENVKTYRFKETQED